MAYNDIIKAVELGHSFVQEFLNDDFRVLKCIQETQEKSEKGYISYITQDDIVEDTGFSKGKVNTAVKFLIERGYIRKEAKGYSLTDAGGFVCVVLG